MLSIRLCGVCMFIYKIIWLSIVIYWYDFNSFLMQLEWIRNRKEAVGREWGRRLRKKGDVTVAGENLSLKRRMFTPSEKLKVSGTEDECKKKKIMLPLSFLLQRSLQDLHHRT